MELSLLTATCEEAVSKESSIFNKRWILASKEMVDFFRKAATWSPWEEPGVIPDPSQEVPGKLKKLKKLKTFLSVFGLFLYSFLTFASIFDQFGEAKVMDFLVVFW